MQLVIEFKLSLPYFALSSKAAAGTVTILTGVVAVIDGGKCSASFNEHVNHTRTINAIIVRSLCQSVVFLFLVMSLMHFCVNTTGFLARNICLIATIIKVCTANELETC